MSERDIDHAVHLALGYGYRVDDKYGEMYFFPTTTPGVVNWDSNPKPYKQAIAEALERAKHEA